MKLRYLPLLLLPFATHAQGPVYQVDMQEQKLLLPDANFYVTDVLDLRVNNRTIGRVQRGLSNVAVPADLKGGAGPAGRPARHYAHSRAAHRGSNQGHFREGPCGDRRGLCGAVRAEL